MNLKYLFLHHILIFRNLNFQIITAHKKVCKFRGVLFFQPQIEWQNLHNDRISNNKNHKDETKK